MSNMNNTDEIVKSLLTKHHLLEATTFVGVIDGNKSQTLREFIKEVSVVFEFPDYFSYNMNSFREMINDLSWLNKDNYILAITSPSSLLAKEKNEEAYLNELLGAISKEWNNVPNYDGEELYRKKSAFIVSRI